MKEHDKKAQEELEKLHQHVKELEKKFSETENSWKRALADYQNLEKRSIEDKELISHYVKKQTIESFLPLLDNLEKIEKHIKDKGLELTLKEFKNTLKALGVEEINVIGADFDHNTMEAIETRKGETGKVIDVCQKGYLLNGKLLRPTKVIVGKE